MRSFDITLSKHVRIIRTFKHAKGDNFGTLSPAETEKWVRSLRSLNLFSLHTLLADVLLIGMCNSRWRMVILAQEYDRTTTATHYTNLEFEGFSRAVRS